MSAPVGYTLGPLTPDQIDFVHSLPASVLVAAANGRVDFNLLAAQELANRGLSRKGAWLGFERARAEYTALARSQGASAAKERRP